MDLILTVLLIIDIQNDYFQGGKKQLEESLAASANTKKVLSYFRKHKIKVIHVQHKMIEANPSFFIPNTEGEKINKLVMPLVDEKLIIKNHVSSFKETELLKYLHDLGVKNIVLTGMQTNVCVQGFVDDSASSDFNIILIKDATAAVSKEIRDKTLKYLSAFNNVRITTTDDLLKTIKEGKI